MKRISLTVAYDGTNYCGWQLQPNAVTIEGMLNNAIKKLTGEDVRVTGASRTDSGVHALGNVAVFDTDTRIAPERIAAALNTRLPSDIVAVKSSQVPADFHPRRGCVSKTYEYHIINSRIQIPTKRLTNYFVSYPLDTGKMRQAAEYLVGEHDFASFCNIRTNSESTVRRIMSLDIISNDESGMEAGQAPDGTGLGTPGDRAITIRVTGNGFLYHMVRIISGTLLRVGRGYYEPERMKEILDARCRQAAGPTAPPQGLMLMEIKYDKRVMTDEKDAVLYRH